MDKTEIKKILLEQCKAFVQQRIDVAGKMIEDARESAGEESKSSAGDKYETGRAMMHLEQEKYSHQLGDALKVSIILNLIDPTRLSAKAQLGSVVVTSLGNYFIAISAGRITIDGRKYFAISPQAPLAQQFHNLKAGDSVVFNEREVRILEVF